MEIPIWRLDNAYLEPFVVPRIGIHLDFEGIYL